MAIHIDHARANRTGTTQSQAEKRFGSCVIALEREPEIDRVSIRVNSPIQVYPATRHADLDLVHTPGAVPVPHPALDSLFKIRA